MKASQPNGNDRKHPRPLRTILLVNAIGVEFGACVAGGYFLGEWMRSGLGSVLWVLFGLTLGVAAGVWSAAVLIKKVIGAHKDE